MTRAGTTAIAIRSLNQREIAIMHGDDAYRLRLTSQNKLTK